MVSVGVVFHKALRLGASKITHLEFNAISRTTSAYGIE